VEVSVDRKAIAKSEGNSLKPPTRWVSARAPCTGDYRYGIRNGPQASLPISQKALAHFTFEAESRASPVRRLPPSLLPRILLGVQ